MAADRPDDFDDPPPPPDVPERTLPDTPTAPPAAETDPRFPSGPWTGFFLQPHLPGGKHWMELSLQFRDGLVEGSGRDVVGSFTVLGAYHLNDGRCQLRKTYRGHHVRYEGYNEGKGIYGAWSIVTASHGTLSGGFHIWPKGMPDPHGPKKAAKRKRRRKGGRVKITLTFTVGGPATVRRRVEEDD